MTAPREPHRPPSPPDRRPSPRGGHPSSQTASAAGRPAGFARLTGARRGLVHSVRTLAAAALLALVGGLALPATAQAQSETLVTNLSYSDDGFLAVALRSAQSFRTGDHSAGYKLDAVELRIRKPTGSTRGLEVKLYTESASGNPANVLFTFPALAIPTGTGNLRFEAPAGTRLDPNTTYFIVFKQSGGSGGNSSAGTTKNLGQTGFDNWSIADKRTYHGGSWTSVQGEAYRMTVLGVAASTDATLSGLTVTGGGSDLVTFVSGTTDYTAMVANAVAEVTVTAMTNDTGATIEYLDGDDATLTDADTGVTGHQVTLAEGDNVIKVKVTAEDASTQTYTVTVTRAADTDTTAPTLISAIVGRSGGTTTLQFSEDLPLTVGEALSATAQGAFSRTVNGVAQNIADIRRDFLTAYSLVVYHKTVYSGQTVVVSYDQSAAGIDAIADAAGNEVVDFTTGSGGVPVVTNSSTQVAPPLTLSALVVNDGNVDLTLTPTFVSGTTTYTAMVASTVAEVTVTAMTTNSGESIEYLDGDDATLDDAGTAAGHQVAVAEGDNVIKVKVTAADGNTTQTYTVTVTRAAATRHHRANAHKCERCPFRKFHDPLVQRGFGPAERDNSLCDGSRRLLAHHRQRPARHPRDIEGVWNDGCPLLDCPPLKDLQRPDRRRELRPVRGQRRCHRRRRRQRGRRFHHRFRWSARRDEQFRAGGARDGRDAERADGDRRREVPGGLRVGHRPPTRRRWRTPSPR